MITHAFDIKVGPYTWTKCGVRDSPQAPIAFDKAPTCLWCVAGRKTNRWTGPLSDIIEMNSVKEIQDIEDSKLVEHVNAQIEAMKK